MSKSEETESTELLRPLVVLAPLIQKELEAGAAAGLEHYRRAGEMLLEAREQCKHGEWTAWVERNFRLSQKTAQNYMKLAGFSKTKRAAFSTLSSATEPHRDPSHRPTPPAWQKPVQRVVQGVNMKALVADQQSRLKEEKLVRELCLQIIDIGYKVLAAKLHPDKGGSAEAMARLNKARRNLKEAV